jgi:hypothetical protein
MTDIDMVEKRKLVKGIKLKLGIGDPNFQGLDFGYPGAGILCNTWDSK